MQRMVVKINDTINTPKSIAVCAFLSTNKHTGTRVILHTFDEAKEEPNEICDILHIK